ncbi:hypothetical protein GCM10009682_28400 [Luedemannella flava]|uniref:V-type ATP synthase subunit I n=1 Tax=Luedemannella flava TaxID=349316 RepID=A0ABN2M030_9ACTN
MRWREAFAAVPMTRVAVVAPAELLRTALVRVADAGCLDIDRLVPAADQPAASAAQALQRLALPDSPEARLLETPPDIATLVEERRADLLAGETQLADLSAQVVDRDGVAALLGWAPTATLPTLAARLRPAGATVVTLPAPRGVLPPTVVDRPGPGRTFAPLVNTYATTPYVDVDVSVPAGLAYVVMFGAMFADVGHGVLLFAGAVVVRLGLVRRLAPLWPHWAFLAAAGVSTVAFGLVFGECFGPTGLVPAGLVAPLEQPVAMLLGGIALGAVLLAGAFALGTVNRFREGGWALALYAPSGAAGALLFAALGTAAAAWYAHSATLATVAAGSGAAGLALAYAGLFAAAGGGWAGAAQATIETVDLLVRLAANVVSFARIAAFGLTHAVLGSIVWAATVGLWHRGAAGSSAAVVVFALGNTVAFALAALVAGVQALRLEYYELFSRVFQMEGRPYRPWHVPLASTKE